MRRALLVLVMVLALPAAAAAQCPKTTLGDVEDEVMCPVCGTPLGLATEAPQAIRERAFIERLVDDCRSKAEIKAALVDEFGDEVLALPSDDGFNAAAYVVPVLAVLFGLGAIVLAVRRWRRRPVPQGPAADPDVDDARLTADLERYDL